MRKTIWINTRRKNCEADTIKVSRVFVLNLFVCLSFALNLIYHHFHSNVNFQLSLWSDDRILTMFEWFLGFFFIFPTRSDENKNKNEYTHLFSNWPESRSSSTIPEIFPRKRLICLIVCGTVEIISFAVAK